MLQIGSITLTSLYMATIFVVPAIQKREVYLSWLSETISFQ